MIRDLVLDAQAAEPAIRQVHLHLAAQQPLRADGEHVAEDEHPDHEHRIDRRPAEVGVVGRQLGVHPGQVQHGSDLAHAVIVRHDLIEAERIEQLPLIPVEPPHHRQPPRRHHLSAGESRFAAHSNGLLQQNRHKADIARGQLRPFSAAKQTSIANVRHVCFDPTGPVSRLPGGSRLFPSSGQGCRFVGTSIGRNSTPVRCTGCG